MSRSELAAAASLVMLLSAGCATSYAGFLAEGKSRQVPVLIYDTSWNDPWESPTWRLGDPIPRDALHIALVDSGGSDVATVWLHVAHCDRRGGPELEEWLRFDGPFLRGRQYADAQALGTDMNYLRVGTSAHLVILGARVDDAGGTHEFHDDVDRLLTSGISNFCPKL